MEDKICKDCNKPINGFNYGYGYLPQCGKCNKEEEILHKQGKALDIEIEQQDVAQSEYWIHNDIRDDIYLVTFNNCGEIKSINIVAKSESEAMDLALELSNSNRIYSAIKL